MTTPAVLTSPLSADQARKRATDNDGVLEVVVVLDVLDLIGCGDDRLWRAVVEEVVEDRSQVHVLHPLRLLGDAPGYPTGDPRRQYMLVRVRVELYP